MTMQTIILLAAKAAKVSGPLLLAICMQESNLNANAMLPVDGNSPTYGICQVKLETARMVGYKGDVVDLMVPQENAKWAAIYLKYQMARYGGDQCKAVAAYNAGTYNESKKAPGKPRNLRYVRNVQSKLSSDLQESLSCAINKEVAEITQEGISQ